MYEEKIDVEKHLRQRQRLQALTETQVWREDIKPFLVGKLTAARAGIFHSEDDSTHWQAIGIYGHLEHFFEFVEEIKIEEQLWRQKKENENQGKKTLPNQQNWWKRILRKKERKT